MFRRVVFEEWMQHVPIVIFIAVFLVFIGITIRAVMMRKDKESHMASLPLQDDAEEKAKPKPEKVTEASETPDKQD